MRNTWIVVADSSRARIFSAGTPTAKLTEVASLDHPQSRAKAKDLVEDGPSSTFSSVGASRHGVGADASPKLHEHEVFAREVVRTLERGRSDNRFDMLVLIAPATFLGLLKQSMGGPLAKLVQQTVAKDLTQLDAAQIRNHIEPASLGALA
jgi:protein required for attachment to host cells